MLAVQLEKHLLNFSARIAHSNIRRYADIEEQISFLWRAAGTPGMAPANATQVDDRFLPAVSCLLLPFGDPLHDGPHQLVHAADRSEERRVGKEWRSRLCAW